MFNRKARKMAKVTKKVENEIENIENKESEKIGLQERMELQRQLVGATTAVNTAPLQVNTMSPFSNHVSGNVKTYTNVAITGISSSQLQQQMQLMQQQYNLYNLPNNTYTTNGIITFPQTVVGASAPVPLQNVHNTNTTLDLKEVNQKKSAYLNTPEWEFIFDENPELNLPYSHPWVNIDLNGIHTAITESYSRADIENILFYQIGQYPRYNILGYPESWTLIAELKDTNVIYVDGISYDTSWANNYSIRRFVSDDLEALLTNILTDTERNEIGL